MDRKAIIAVTLSIVVMIAWQFVYVPRHRHAVAPVVAPAAPEASASPEPAPSPSEIAAARPSEPVPAPPAEEAENEVPEQAQTIETAVATYQFTNRGGGIRDTILLKHLAEQGEPVVLNHYSDVPIGAVSEDPRTWKTSGFEMSLSEDRHSIVLRRTVGPVELVKTFHLPADDPKAVEYAIHLDIEWRNTGGEPYVSTGPYVNVGSAAPVHPRDLATYTAFDWLRKGRLTEKSVPWFEPGRVPLLGIQIREGRTEYLESADGIVWAGVKNQYFTTLLTAPDEDAASVYARRFQVELDGEKVYAIQGALGFPGFSVPPGGNHKISLRLYAGPKEYKRLKALGQDQAETMQYGIFKPVSVFLLAMMNWLKGVLGNYAAAIFVMTLIIKSALWPLQNASTRSMKKMQALQPKMTELREKYKDDPTRMNQELMKLYKDYGINPFGGCLPMFIQIPIFFGFYRMLGVATELRNSHFLWIKDLSQPDTVFHLGTFPVNILPLIMAATMIWQMQLTPKSGDGVQQRVFMFVPLIFVVFCYNFASALALYWTVQNLFSIVQLYLTRNESLPALKKAAAPDAGKPKRKRS